MVKESNGHFFFYWEENLPFQDDQPKEGRAREENADLRIGTERRYS
jgi:hypothetical protein